MLDGATRRRLIRMTPLFEEHQTADHLILPFDPSFQSFNTKEKRSPE